MFFNFTPEYAIRKVQVNKMGLKLNRTHQLLAYVDDVHVFNEVRNNRNNWAHTSFQRPVQQRT
jgi:hypothetical protein